MRNLKKNETECLVKYSTIFCFNSWFIWCCMHSEYTDIRATATITRILTSLRPIWVLPTAHPVFKSRPRFVPPLQHHAYPATPSTTFYPLLHTFVSSPLRQCCRPDLCWSRLIRFFKPAREIGSPFLSLNPSPFVPARCGFYRRASESLHTKICTNTISQHPLVASFFSCPAASRRLTNKCITHPTADAILLFGSPL